MVSIKAWPKKSNGFTAGSNIKTAGNNTPSNKPLSDILTTINQAKQLIGVDTLKNVSTKNGQIDAYSIQIPLLTSLPFVSFSATITNQFSMPVGVVPVGDSGLYATPNKPVDPTDCANWPTSPYCGGSPFSLAPIDLGINLTVTPCSIGIEFYPTIAFIQFPPLQIIYIKPECIPDPVPTPPANIKFLPFDCGIYEFAAQAGAILLDVKQIISIKRLKGVYTYGSGTVYEDWIIFYKDCNNNIKQVFNFDRLPEQCPLLLNCIYPNGDSYDQEKENPNQLYACYPGNGAKASAGKVLANPVGLVPFGKLYPCPCNLVLPPPPPKKKKEDDDMGCCDLVAVLLKKIQRIEEVIGVDEYPATLPATLITKNESFLEKVVDTVTGNKHTVDIPSMTSLMEWQIKRFDEIMGQFEIPIQIKHGEDDAQADTAKLKGFNLPNIAESIAEMMGLLLHISYNSELLVNMNTRNLLETGQTKLQGFKTYMVAEAIMEYLGFSHKDADHKIAFTFTPDKHNFRELLVETEVDITAIEFDEKYNLKHTLIELLNTAAIVRAVNFRHVAGGTEMAQSIVDFIKNSSKINQNIDKGKIDSDGSDDFDRFIKDAEGAFLGTADPWGDDYDHRPKITRIKPNKTT